MVKKFKELKRVYIPYTNMYEPITDDDKISLEKSIISFKKRIIIATILFIISFIVACILIYEFFTKDNISLMDTVVAIKGIVFMCCFLLGISTFFFTLGSIKIIKQNKKILESKQIRVVRGIVESRLLCTVSTYIDIVDGPKFRFLTCHCRPGQLIEFRYNPYTIKRLDDNLYDVNFIYEHKYLMELEECKVQFLKLQEELSNTSPRKWKKIADLNEDIIRVKEWIESYNNKMSELPRKIHYIKEKVK